MDITLYHSRFSRSMATYWLLEELAVPFRVIEKDIASGHQKDADLLALNAHGKVPTVVADGEVLTERAAICLTLADRLSYGTLAPRIEAAARAPYVRWTIYSVSVLEAAMLAAEAGSPIDGYHAGWGDLTTVVDVVEGHLEASQWVAGDTFSAADTLFGAVLGWGLIAGMLERRDAFSAYEARMQARPAFQRAAAATYTAPPVS